MQTHRNLITISALFGALLMTPMVSADESAAGDLSLELIMSDPEWVARSPANEWISDDGNTVYYSQEQLGSSRMELMRVDVSQTAPFMPGEPERVPDEDLPGIGSSNGFLTQDRAYKVWTRDGDVFVRRMPDGEIRQLTRTASRESNARFIGDDPRQIAWSVGDDWFKLDLGSGLTTQIAHLTTDSAPSDSDPDDYAHRMQLRIFETLRRDVANEDLEEARSDDIEAADPTRSPDPIYLGTSESIIWTDLSPAGTHLLVATAPSDQGGWENDQMPVWVTRSGYVEVRDVRSRVGTGPDRYDTLHMVDLGDGSVHTLDRSGLPDIDDDPLRELRVAAAERAGEEPPERDAVRATTVWGAEWSPDGAEVLIHLRSEDNKDRWLATVDMAEMELLSRYHYRDPQWVGYSFLEMGWLPDSSGFWFISEEPGYAHLFVRELDARRARQVTEGEWEVYEPVLTQDGSTFFFRGNIDHPGRYGMYAVSSDGGEPMPVGDPGLRVDSFQLFPDESRLLITASTADSPPDLWVNSVAPGPSGRITDTVTPEFAAIDWVDPELISYPSSHQDRPIYARLYLPADYDPTREYPAVIFTHGAGYLQEAFDGWSYYFREFMFNTLLTRHGYIVISPDYRASRGYGHDWRTAIYRQMGHPEVEDMLDAKAFLVSEYNVDPDRIGTYGGSYGGFLTFMALFRAPGEFAAGASIRPVTDWAAYNHGYTSNILNTPEIDPEAYETSSPIEFAEGLEDQLLILHGLLDDNVFAQDTIRLQHRLIELKKENYETVLYPREPHGFVTPEAWLDEYRRIFALFEEHLGDPD
jgi:dipeptidyl aminopeptidase/acylaminoacyl peptidase